MNERLPTTRMKLYVRRANAERRARRRVALYPQMTMAIVETPLGYAAVRADHVDRYDLSGGRVVGKVTA